MVMIVLLKGGLDVRDAESNLPAYFFLLRLGFHFSHGGLPY